MGAKVVLQTYVDLKGAYLYLYLFKEGTLMRSLSYMSYGLKVDSFG
jgi:hypothetical protein